MNRAATATLQQHIHTAAAADENHYPLLLWGSCEHLTPIGHERLVAVVNRIQWDKTLKAVVIDNPRPINLEVSKWSGKIRIRRKVTKEALKYIIRRRLRVLNAIISNFKMQFNPK